MTIEDLAREALRCCDCDNDIRPVRSGSEYRLVCAARTGKRLYVVVEDDCFLVWEFDCGRNGKPCTSRRKLKSDPHRVPCDTLEEAMAHYMSAVASGESLYVNWWREHDR